MEIGKELAIDEVAKVIAGLPFVVVKLTVFALWCGPFVPAILLVEDEVVLLSFIRIVF